MDLQYLRRLVKIFDDSAATELEIEEEGVRLFMSKQNQGAMQYGQPLNQAPMQPYMPPTPQQNIIPNMPVNKEHPQAQSDVQNSPVSIVQTAEQASEDESDFHVITSPIVGTFYRAPSPESGPFVEIGTHVAPGATLCIVEAMKLMNEIESDVSGIIAKILIENGQPVEFGQKIFLVKPD